MVNDSKVQLMCLIVLFGLSITQLIFYDASPTESEIFANATNQASNDNEETGNQEETTISNNQNCTKILLG